MQFLAPLMLPKNSIGELSGVTLINDNTNSFEKLQSPWNFVYSVGDRLCHQKTERSLILNDNQMPFCSRCTGIWMGIIIGLGFIMLFRINLDSKFIIFIFIGIFPIGIDGIGQLIGLWESTNISRVITGLLAGLITGLTIGIIIDEITDMNLLKKRKIN